MEGLDELTQLETLSLGYLGGHSQSQLSHLIAQEYYRSNFIQQIENLHPLKKLTTLDLGGNLLTEIKGLENQQTLETLYLGHNQIQEMGGIDHFTQLKTLSLGYITPNYTVSTLLNNERTMSKKLSRKQIDFTPVLI